jgi:L-seryl-tRNA(Ser) seleniumtransferase
MLSLTQQQIATRATALIARLSPNSTSARFELMEGESAIGGGAGPTANLPTTLIAITDVARSAQEIEMLLRTSQPPLITRIADQKVLIDLRTVFPEQEPTLIASLAKL